MIDTLSSCSADLNMSKTNPGESAVKTHLDFSPNSRFLVDPTKTGQYNHLYFNRLMQLKPRLSQRVTQLFPSSDAEHIAIEDLDIGKKSWILGNVLKAMPNKPSLVAELNQDRSVDTFVEKNDYTSQEDITFLQDDNQKVQLSLDDPHRFVSGQTLALLGAINKKGLFEIESCCLPSIPNEDLGSRARTSNDVILVISGLGFNENEAAERFNRLSDFLNGITSFGSDFDSLAARTTTIIIAGNICVQSAAVRDKLHRTAHYIMKNKQPFTSKAISLANNLFPQLLPRFNIICMPGHGDPAGWMLPQQPPPIALLTCAKSNSSMHMTTNPCEFMLNGVRLVGTAGQNVTDYIRHQPSKTPIEVMSCNLEHGHLAPTAPDTLPAYSAMQTDPFVIPNVPDIYFVGNQDLTASKIVEIEGRKTLLLSVSQFVQSGEVAFVDTANMDVKVLKLPVSSSYENNAVSPTSLGMVC